MHYNTTNNSNVRMTWLRSLLAEPFLSCSSKRLFDELELASLSPRQIKSKEFKSEERE